MRSSAPLPARAWWLVLLLTWPIAAVLQAAPPSKPGQDVRTPDEIAKWMPLIERLASRPAIYSKFTEKRWFPFRLGPVKLEGEMRFSKATGLSLHYTEPIERTVIIDSEGLLLRDGKGHQKVGPSDGRISQIADAMLAVMQFNVKHLLQYFSLRADRAGDDWRFDLVPRESTQRTMLHRITIFGNGARITHLIFEHSPHERVEVFISRTSTLASFSASDRKEFFR